MAEITDRYADYDRVTIKLLVPVKITLKSSGGGEREEVFEELTMREPDAADLEDVDLAHLRKIGNSYPIVARLCDVNVAVIKKLRLKDMARVGEAFFDFLPDGLMTGLL